MLGSVMDSLTNANEELKSRDAIIERLKMQPGKKPQSANFQNRVTYGNPCNSQPNSQKMSHYGDSCKHQPSSLNEQHYGTSCNHQSNSQNRSHYGTSCNHQPSSLNSQNRSHYGDSCNCMHQASSQNQQTYGNRPRFDGLSDFVCSLEDDELEFNLNLSK
jgi:hypothetical protein